MVKRVCLLLLLLPLLAGCAGNSLVEPRTTQQGARRSEWAQVVTDRGVAPRRAELVAGEIEWLHPRLQRDFGVVLPPLRVHVYASHARFATQMWKEQGVRAQSSADDTGSVKRGWLLLGPAPQPYMRHNLAHVYAEWALDHVIGNTSDALPSYPWLYDGLAEYEAYRYAPAGFACRVGSAPFRITEVRTAAAWWQLRQGPWGALEYCLAEKYVSRAVQRIGWRELITILRRPGAWEEVAKELAGA